jgi:serpin B
MLDCPGVPANQQDAGCYAYDLRLSVPRFGIETRADLNKLLIDLGMPLAFDGGAADFSGIHTPGPLYIGTVVHQATIDVDEKGTEAAAATAVGMDTGGGPSPVETITLKLDHPFLFFVRDLDTGAVLFMGRVMDPSAAKGQ